MFLFNGCYVGKDVKFFPNVRDKNYNKQETIIGVYVRFKEGVIVLPRPFRHHHCFKLKHFAGFKDNDKYCEADQGFVTSFGILVNRKRALEIARKAGQLKTTRELKELFSEDVWDNQIDSDFFCLYKQYHALILDFKTKILIDFDDIQVMRNLVQIASLAGDTNLIKVLELTSGLIQKLIHRLIFEGRLFPVPNDFVLKHPATDDEAKFIKIQEIISM